MAETTTSESPTPERVEPMPPPQKDDPSADVEAAKSPSPNRPQQDEDREQDREPVDEAGARERPSTKELRENACPPQVADFGVRLEAERIGQVANGGSVTVNLGSSPMDRERPREPVDTTVPFTEERKFRITFDAATLDGWQRTLEEERLLTLSCHDREVLLSAAGGIRSRLQPNVRSLRFREDVGEITFDRLLHHHWADGTLVVADLVRTPTAAIFRDSVARNLLDAIGTHAALANRKRYLLLLTEPSPDASLPSQTLDFVEPLLKESRFRSRAVEWAVMLAGQREEGFWSDSEAEFHRQFRKHLESDTLEAAIQSPPERRPPAAKQIVVGEDLANAALFLASFYPPLPVEDFHRLLCRLVAGKTRKEVRTVYEMSEEGAGSSRVVETAVPLETIARERYDELYTGCGLLVVPAAQEISLEVNRQPPPRGPVIELDHPERADQVRRELLTLDYLTLVGFVDRVAGDHLLLDNSHPVVRGTIELMRVMASTDSSRFGVPQVVDLLERAAHEPILRGPILSRLYLLLREFPDDPSLSAELDRLLNGLIGSGRHDDALQLVKRLRFAAGFDHVGWWKQLLARTNLQTRGETVGEIFTTLYKDRTQFPQTLRQLGAWLPADDGDFHQPWVVCANEILFQTLNNSIKLSLFRRCGYWPPEEPLHVALLDLEQRDGEMPVLEWMFHASFLGREQLGWHDLAKHLVWWWLVPPPSLPVDSEFGSPRWLERLFEPPEDGIDTRATLHGFVLADLALEVEMVDDDAERREAGESLRRVVEAARDLASEHRMERDLLDCWARLQTYACRLLELADEDGISPEQRQSMAPRVHAQVRGLRSLQSILRNPRRAQAKPAAAVLEASAAEAQAGGPVSPPRFDEPPTSEEPLVL